MFVLLYSLFSLCPFYLRHHMVGGSLKLTVLSQVQLSVPEAYLYGIISKKAGAMFDQTLLFQFTRASRSTISPSRS